MTTLRPALLYYGDTPVPYTASWSAEEDTFHLARCPYFDRLAICQADARGQGKPQFGKPHSNRQRQVIADGLCDLCALPLAAKTKVSLSHAKVRLDGAVGPCVMQVEPLLHRACARISLAKCPSLKRDVRTGEVRIRQIGRYQVQCALMSEIYVKQVCGQPIVAAGHAKVVLLAWKDRVVDWLEAT